MAVSVVLRGSPQVNARLARVWIGVGAALGPIGVGLCVLGPSHLGAWLVIFASLAGVFGLHRLGRSGPDQPG